MKTLGIIPARSGSQRLPGKNLAEINGRSLLKIAVDCGSGLDQLVVSTDLDAAQLATAGLPRHAWSERLLLHPRPPALATGDAASIDVVRDVAGRTDLVAWDVCVLLQPTSPLRTVEDVRGCLALHERNQGDAVVSVTGAMKSDWLFRLGAGGRMRETMPADGLVSPNGAVFLLTHQALSSGWDWFSCPITYAHVMPRERSVDVDTEADLVEARRLAKELAHAV